MAIDWSKAIDWGLAPEDATHFDGRPGVVPAFMRLKQGSESEWMFWITDGWRYYGAFGEAELLIARPSPWNGEGLPPVGTVCGYQHTHHNGAWYDGKILYISDEYTIVKGHPVGEQHYYTRNLNFRPIRTPEQIAAEEREKSAYAMCAIAKSMANVDAFALYDAGYRKQEPKTE